MILAAKGSWPVLADTNGLQVYHSTDPLLLEQRVLVWDGRDFVFGGRRLAAAASAVGSTLALHESLPQFVDRPFFVNAYTGSWSRSIDWQSFDQFDGDILNIPAWGYREGEWLDGPLFHRSDSHLYASFIGRGAAARLRIVDEVSCGGATLDEVQRLYKASVVESLVAALHVRTRTKGDLQLSLITFDLKMMVLAVMFRKAFPDRRLFLTHATEYKQWPPMWKRLAQNLGMGLYERSAVGEVIDVSDLYRTMDEMLATDIALMCNRISHVIPVKAIDA